ncbi:MAG: ring,2-phenylacetyl-CoA epoxidase subunit PaaA [Candidatus Eremiobacteraeota bacterium]|jgi:ring-1,2-phenylacetyl-CoA epoxidase subunit PaaA|nr:ring,2-phenylacetyl-CoA epoxidase subunit PaaA [Candidatus Eremiobacteraeota bacterium]
MDLQAFEQHIAAGGAVDLHDPMPDEYREQVRRIMGFQCLAEIVGGLMFAEWVPRTPGLLRKMMLTAKVQDEMGHAFYLLRTCEDLGLRRDQIVEDYLCGKSKLLNVFHYRIESWHEWPIAALVQNSAALVQFKSLVRTSFRPYARALKRILKEESFHYHNALDLTRTIAGHGGEHRAAVQAGLEKWWPHVLAYFGPPDSDSEHNRRNLRWRLKVDSNDTLRQRWLDWIVPVLESLDLRLPDPALARGGDGRWTYTEPDWDGVRDVIRNGGPATAYWHDRVRDNYESHGWVRDLVYGEQPAA